MTFSGILPYQMSIIYMEDFMAYMKSQLIASWMLDFNTDQ
jgi:hypothetical protein